MRMHTTLLGALALLSPTALADLDLQMSALHFARAQPAPDDSAQAIYDDASATTPLTWDAASLRFDGLIQTRYQANITNGQPTDGYTGGFENPRIRLRTRWNPTERFQAQIQLDAGSGTTEVTLLDMLAEYQIADGVSVRFGQGRIYYSREYSVGIARQLGMDRTVVDRALGVRRGEFINLRLHGDRTRFEFFIADGVGSQSTPFNSPAEANVSLIARAEHLLMGDSFRPFRDFSGQPGTPDSLMAGFAINYEDDASGRPDIIRVTGDLSFETDGANLFGAFHVVNDRTTPGEPTDLGFILQGGHFVSEKTELFARWSVLVPDGDRALDGDFHEFTLGLNHFFIPESHALKLTLELIAYPYDQDDSIVSPSARVALISSTDAQYAARAQFQLAF